MWIESPMSFMSGSTTTSCLKPLLRSISSGNDNNESILAKAFENKIAELIDWLKWETF